MSSELDLLTTILAAMAAVFAFLTFFRNRQSDTKGKSLVELMSLLMRNESDRTRQAGDEQGRAARQELAEGLRAFQDATLRVFRELRDFQACEVRAFGERLDAGIRVIDERVAGIGGRLAEDNVKRSQEAITQAQGIRDLLESRTDDSERKRAVTARELKEELHGTIQALGSTFLQTFAQFGDQQKERLETVTMAVASLSGKHTAGQEALRLAVEGRLDHIRIENAQQLEAMRRTVDEKLQSTLEQRLGESFSRLVQQLEQVHQGIGEMQSLAAGVGDLKRVLTSVKARGTLGEVQAGALLEQFLSPEQFVRDVQGNEGSGERMQFAVRLPGRGLNGDVLLPIDAQFPQADYEHLLAAAEAGNADAVAAAADDLDGRIRSFARSMRDKYIAPPRTTDFAILFLPAEGLYAEVLRRPGLFEQLQRDYHITLTGPATLGAFLNALQMGFRSIALERRSSEVWQILGAVRSEFGKYNDVVDKLAGQLHTALSSVEKLGSRTRAMDRQLRTIEKLPEDATDLLLGASMADAAEMRAEELALADTQ